MAKGSQQQNPGKDESGREGLLWSGREGRWRLTGMGFRGTSGCPQSTEETQQRDLRRAEGPRPPEEVGELPQEDGTWAHWGGLRDGQVPGTGSFRERRPE